MAAFALATSAETASCALASASCRAAASTASRALACAMALGGSSRLIRSHHKSSEAIRSHRKPSEAIRTHQNPSEPIRRHVRNVSGARLLGHRLVRLRLGPPLRLLRPRRRLPPIVHRALDLPQEHHGHSVAGSSEGGKRIEGIRRHQKASEGIRRRRVSKASEGIRRTPSDLLKAQPALAPSRGQHGQPRRLEQILPSAPRRRCRRSRRRRPRGRRLGRCRSVGGEAGRAAQLRSGEIGEMSWRSWRSRMRSAVRLDVASREVMIPVANAVTPDQPTAQPPRWQRPRAPQPPPP